MNTRYKILRQHINLREEREGLSMNDRIGNNCRGNGAIPQPGGTDVGFSRRFESSDATFRLDLREV